MEALDSLRQAINDSGLSMYAVSKLMGKTPIYIGALFSRGSTPRTDTYATIADACGYDLLLRKRDNGAEILIDPPRKEESD